MSERNIKESISKRERNVDALFGFLHIKDKPYLHQRSAQHMFGENDSAVIVPVGTISNVWDGQRGRAELGFGIVLASLIAVGIATFLVYMYNLDPGFVIPFM